MNLNKHSLLVALVFSLLVLSFATFNIPTVNAQGTITQTFTSQTYDGYLTGSDSNYTNAHNKNSGTVIDDDIKLFVGQSYIESEYKISRAFVFFDTSTIPNDAIITSANLEIFIDKYSSVDFNVTIQNGQPIYPHKPLQSGDYYYTHYSGNGGNDSISGWGCLSWQNITLNADGRSWIDKQGVTKLCLRSSRDINFTVPTSLEFIHIYASESTGPKLYVTYDGYQYIFHGLFDESTGLLEGASDRAVNATAYYIDETSETFEVNGTYTYNTTDIPLYFHFELGSKDREYWLSQEEINVDVYIFNASLTTYTIQFLDLAGALNDYPYVEAQRLINGSLMTVEKRKVDEEKKLQFSLVQSCKYTLEIKDGASYTFGDLLFTSTTSMTLTLKGIEFPQNIILGYRYNRVYAYRHSNQSSISICYEDTQGNTADVEVDVQFKNGTSVSGTYPYTYEDTTYFNHTWTGATYNVTYRVQVVITHSKYGTMHYNQIFQRGWTQKPWFLPIGTIPGLDTTVIIPLMLILGCMIVFSKLNAPMGCFAGVTMATVITWIGWIDIPGPLLVAAWTFTILYGIAYKRRNVQEY